MARYEARVANIAPLRIQVGTSDNPIQILAVSAKGLGTTGQVSRPCLSRPSTPGKGTGKVLAHVPRPPEPSFATTGVSVITTFTAAPSYPLVAVGSFNLPLFIEWRVPTGSGMFVPNDDFALLYAFAAGGAKWNGSMEWENL